MFRLFPFFFPFPFLFPCFGGCASSRFLCSGCFGSLALVVVLAAVIFIVSAFVGALFVFLSFRVFLFVACHRLKGTPFSGFSVFVVLSLNLSATFNGLVAFRVGVFRRGFVCYLSNGFHAFGFSPC